MELSRKNVGAALVVVPVPEIETVEDHDHGVVEDVPGPGVGTGLVPGVVQIIDPRKNLDLVLGELIRNTIKLKRDPLW